MVLRLPTPLVVIVDTNVVVAGFLTVRADSPVARVLDGMLAGTLSFTVSEALLAEYQAVMGRPALCKAHGLSAGEIDMILIDLAQRAIVLTPVTAPPAPDPGDQHLWELLASREETILITGDKVLQQERTLGHRVFSPTTFVECWSVCRP
ncbi:MAG: PIN domain-containing protein [Acidiferrobacter sp.]